MGSNLDFVFLKARRLRRSTLYISACGLFALSLTSCLNEQFVQQVDKSSPAVEVFNYETSVNTPLSVAVKDMQGNPVPGVVMDLYYENPFDESGSALKSTASKVMSLVSEQSGAASRVISVPNHITQVYLITKFPGYANPLVFTPSASGVNLTIYPAGYGAGSLRSAAAAASVPSVVMGGNVYKLGNYTTQGVPLYKEADRDTVGTAFKSRISASLPEYSHVPAVSPQLLADASKANIKIIDTCNIWITFISEGADWKNTLGYFYYPTGSAPASISAISKRIVIFPNSSFVNKGGGLVEGDKVKLLYYKEDLQQWTDTFPPNLTLGWFLISEGYKGDTLSNGRYWNYSIPAFNTGGFQQNLILLDKASSRMVMGFEDTRRNAQGTSGDEDFNDALFFASANPFSAIEIEGMVDIKKATDCDKDGVPDAQDAYPCDEERTFVTSSEGSLAFEDNWPYKKDYDFNDFVTDYKFDNITDAKGWVKEINATFTVKAAGADYKNGFALQLNTTPDNIETVTGSRLFGNLFSLTNGVENGQSNAVIPVVDNIYSLYNAYMVNTVENGVAMPDQVINIHITLKDPVDLGSAPYNPFLIVNQDRGREIHLAGKHPTDLANSAYFRTGEDLTNPASGVYYKASRSYPWALNISAKSFAYPIEKESIDQTHLKFSTWATSLGGQFGDWYQNKADYRNSLKIYNK